MHPVWFADGYPTYTFFGRSSLPISMCFSTRLWGISQSFYSGPTALFHSQLHLKFIEWLQREEPRWHVLAFQSPFWYQVRSPVRARCLDSSRRANQSSILDSLFMWDPVATGPAYFSPPYWCVHIISEAVAGEKRLALVRLLFSWGDKEIVGAYFMEMILNSAERTQGTPKQESVYCTLGL